MNEKTRMNALLLYARALQSFQFLKSSKLLSKILQFLDVRRWFNRYPWKRAERNDLFVIFLFRTLHYINANFFFESVSRDNSMTNESE